MPLVSAEDDKQLRSIFVQLCVQPASVLESETLEIKGWCTGEKQLAEKASDSAACLANAHGGIVLLGIGNGDLGQRKFSRSPHRNVTVEWVAQRIQDGTVPPVEMRVVDASSLLQEITEQSAIECFAVFVGKSRRVGGHQTVGGLSRIRSGNECRPYYVAAEDDRTKAPVLFAGANALALQSISWGIQQHKKKFNIHGEQWESEIDFLTHIGLVEPPGRCAELKISLAALLLFGTDRAIRQHCPGLETIVISRLGEKRLHLNIVDSFGHLCGSRNALLRSLCPAIPEICIREILMNCFVHRDYRISSPIIIHAREDLIEFESPGALCTGLSPESLLYCTPVYRNFLLAEGTRYLGLCDKVGRGIDVVYENVLQHGLGFPSFENGENRFTTRITLQGSREFQEFLKRRGQVLSHLDEIIVLRYLYDREAASFLELCRAMQRGHSFVHKTLKDMVHKQMIESDSSLNLEWKLRPSVRSDIEHVFEIDQFNFGFPDLFGEQG